MAERKYEEPESGGHDRKASMAEAVRFSRGWAGTSQWGALAWVVLGDWHWKQSSADPALLSRSSRSVQAPSVTKQAAQLSI